MAITLARLISGGQWGGDMGGLLAAEDLGIPTGGTAPKGWRTENGSNPELGHRFGLYEHPSNLYPPRTLANVREADGTAIFVRVRKLDRGSALTAGFCLQYRKPFIVNPSVNAFRQWLETERIQVLNVAGNRESRAPGIQERVRAFIVRALTP